MSCLGECLDLGPPPDSILFLPPPPAPSFLQHSIPDLLLNTTPCSAAQLCDSVLSSNHIPTDDGEYIEMPRKDIESWSGIDDTWLLVLVASSIGVLLLGALLAMFLLKCREMNMFGASECSVHARDHHRHMKTADPRDCASVANLNGNKFGHPSESVLYHGGPHMQDNRMVWAALTPRGTQHFVSDNYPRQLIEYGDLDDHYETIEGADGVPPADHYRTYRKDYDYEDPTPLIESCRFEGEPDHYQPVGNTDMRCASLGMSTMRRSRPRVSSPTRIEHPNLPPLNLYPHKGNTIKKQSGTLSYRSVDAGSSPKYGI